MMENRVEHGPLLEGGMLTAGLDFYKPTMSQLAYEKEPEAEVTFTFHNRGTQRILEYVDAGRLQARLDDLRERGFQNTELSYLASRTDPTGRELFGLQYIDYLAQGELPEVTVSTDEANDIAIQTTGKFPLVTFWETVVMSEVNEAYFEGYIADQGLNLLDVYNEGDRRLSEKIEILQANPDIKFADFGTRRHFSLRWQRHVFNRLSVECPDNFIGTSNVGLAATLNLPPIGTFAHEMPMVYAGLADGRGEDIRNSHQEFLEDWYNLYGESLSTALTDTFGSEFFFSDFTPEQAEKWKGLRHDSGDPFEFGERVIDFYTNLGINPLEKNIVFSDGLDIDTILALHERFKGRVNCAFGWGTTLTNDLGIQPLNIVMKATEVNGQPTVKLSDNESKHTGPEDFIDRYKQIFSKLTAAVAREG